MIKSKIYALGSLFLPRRKKLSHRKKAANIASRLPYHPKIWKPNLIVPVEEGRSWLGIAEFIKDIVYPNGRAVFFTVIDKHISDKIVENKKVLEALKLMSVSMKEEGIFVSTLAIDSTEFLEGAITVTQTLMGSDLPPNVLFIKLGLNKEKDHAITSLIIKANTMGLGIMVFRLHPKSVFGQKQVVNIWIRKMSLIFI